GDFAGARLRTWLPHHRRAAEAGNVVLALEKDNEVKNPDQPSPLAEFCQQDHLRLLHLAGEGATITETSYVADFAERKYVVTIHYRIDSPACAFEMGITLEGAEQADSDNVVRRGWRVRPDMTGIQKRELVELKDAQPLRRVGEPARRFVMMWMEQLMAKRDRDQAFLLTLPGEQRTGAAREAALKSPERTAFAKGSLIDAKDAYWSDKGSQEAVMAGLRALFDPASTDSPAMIRPVEKVNYPQFKIEGGRIRIRIDLSGKIVEPSGKPRYVFDAELVVEGPPEGLPSSLEKFRIVSLKVVRGKVPNLGAPG
ncbi:MAG: hypothetical protein K2W96_20735, partial [Gemmataceae bacterium]|nr:hypothetical protein [Gemmataceae bacterium]